MKYDDLFKGLDESITWLQEVEKKELTSEARNKLSDSAFAYVDSNGKGHLPIPDAAHVRAALSRFNQTSFESDEAKTKAKAKIDAAARKFKIGDYAKSGKEVAAGGYITESQLKAKSSDINASGYITEAPSPAKEKDTRERDKARAKEFEDGLREVLGQKKPSAKKSSAKIEAEEEALDSESKDKEDCE